jgi:hypothetical protein
MRNAKSVAGKVQTKEARSVPNYWCLFVVIALLPTVSFLNGCTGLVKGASQTITALFQLSPASLNFGNVTVGRVSTQTVTVANTGSVSVNITQATFSNSQFTLSGTTLPMALAAGQSGNLSVAVNAPTAGTVSGTMTVTGDGGSSPAVVNLSATAVASSQPQLLVSPASVAFGTVPNGLTSTTNLTLTNTGTGNLSVSVIAITGSQFSISGITTPKTISAGQSAQAAVTFSPTATGAVTGSISITSNDPSNPTVTIPLTGTGSATPTGQLNASAPSLIFGTVAMGSTAKQQVTVTNNGNASVNISTLSVSTGFSVTGLTVPATLDPSETATVTVTFAPSAVGNTTGSIVITSNAANSPLTIALNGTAAQAGLSVSSSSYGFGSVIDGQTKSENFTITNTGAAPLTISQLSASGAPYSVSGLTLPATISAGAMTTFSVLFAPTNAGNFTGTVAITSNAPNSPASISLGGTGTASTVTLSASTNSLSYTGIYVGGSSAQNVIITNNGNTSATISQVNVNAKDFTTSGITTPLTLAAGQSATLQVIFAPSASENVEGNITVSTSQGGSAVVSVFGNGVQPALTITPSSVSFGSVTLGSPISQTIQLTNSGTGTLSISQLNVTGSGFSTNSLSLPVNLTAGQSTTFNAEFSPTATGAVTGGVSIVSNAAGSPATIALSGTGVAQTLALSFSSTSLAFGSVNMGNSSTLPETIKNTGNSNVQISQITESGAGFSLSGASTPVTLSPNQTTTFNVIFDPTSSGSSTGTVTVTSNASGPPTTIALAGQTASYTVSLAWTASTSTVSGYNIYRSTTNGSGYSRINSSLVGPVSYADSTVQNGVTYYYVTTAVDSSGNESGFSNQATAVIP